jgi:hypothetical protein
MKEEISMNKILKLIVILINDSYGIYKIGRKLMFITTRVIAAIYCNISLFHINSLLSSTFPSFAYVLREILITFPSSA